MRSFFTRLHHVTGAIPLISSTVGLVTSLSLCGSAVAESNNEQSDLQSSLPVNRVVFFGLVCEDNIARVLKYPKEDSKSRAIVTEDCDFIRRLGGNAANSSIAAASVNQLLPMENEKRIIECLAPLCDGFDADFALNRLRESGVSTELCMINKGGRMTKSWIILSEENSTRTIINFPSSKPVTLDQFQNVLFNDRSEEFVKSISHIHFEGRWLDQTPKLTQFAYEYPGMTVSVEIEKELPNVDDLLPWADVLFFSKDLVKGRGFSEHTLSEFVKTIRNEVKPGSWLIFPWGSLGCFGIQINNDDDDYYEMNMDDFEYEFEFVQSIPLSADEIQETLGAGDTFIAAFVMAFNFTRNIVAINDSNNMTRQRIRDCLTFAARVAENKIQHSGFDKLRELSHVEWTGLEESGKDVIHDRGDLKIPVSEVVPQIG